MKTFILFIASIPVFAQCSFPAQTFPIQMPGDAAVSVTMSAEAVCSMIANIMGSVAPGTTATALTANATNSQTTFQVSSITGVTTCNGILIGTELSLITAISGTGPYTLTVTRHTVGTSAAAYSTGQAATYTAYGNGSCAVTGQLAQMILGGMSPGAFPGPNVAAAKAAIATQQATINSTIAAGVTHVP